MAKRGHGEGSITQRADDNRWMARLMVDGRRKTVYGATRKEVQDKLDRLKREMTQGLSALDERQTVGQYLATWHETIRSRIAPSSHQRYGDYIKHLTTHIGQIKLVRLTPQQLQLCYARMLDGGLSKRTVNLAHTMFKQALGDAFTLELVPRNVAAMVKPPRAVRPKITPMDEDQARAFLDACKGERLEAMHVLALTTGMRLGELLGLRWQDVDLARQTITVNQNMQRQRGVPGGFVPSEPKTSHSRRTIGLTRLAADALARHWQQMQLEGHGGTLVFCTLSGGHYHNPRMIAGKWFNQLLDKAGLPHVFRYHDLRHTCATLLLSHGVNVKVVSEMLGHASVSITLNIYAHVLPHMQQSAVNAMASLLASPEAGKIVDATS